MSKSPSAVGALRAPGPGQTTPLPSLRTADVRADLRARTVDLGPKQVTIARRLLGIDMRIGVPVHSYNGVSLSLTGGSDSPESAASGSAATGAAATWRVTLLHRDPDLSVPLAEAQDDSDVIADWRAWSKFFGLPALVELEPGRFQASLDSRPISGSPRTTCRRRGAMMTKRRARFLLRRRMGDKARCSQSHAGEREIIARN